MEAIKRSEVKIENTWNTSDIFSTNEKWQKTLDHCIEEFKSFKNFEGELNNAKSLLDFFEKLEEVTRTFQSVYHYAVLNNDVDISNSDSYANLAKVKEASVKFNQSLAFSNVEILKIDNSKLEGFYNEIPALRKYERSIKEIMRDKNHTLTEKEESLLALMGEINQSPKDTFMILNNADMKFDDAIDANGYTHRLSNASYLSLLSNKDRVLREDAFKKLFKGYGSLNNTLAQILSTQNKMLATNATARNFNSAIEASLHNTNVPIETYHNLIKTVHSKIGVLHKYMALRKKVLNVEELHMYDLYVPMLDEYNISVPFEEAVNNVLESTMILGKDYYQTLKKGFESRWVDIYENIGKRSGAYSMGVNVHPFVLMNYSETLDSEFTLAHEMGHAMHSYLSTRNQNYLDSKYVIFVAEVASTCNEALLMDYLLKNNDDIKFKAFLINHFLEQFRTTLYRQCMFAEFELKISELQQSGVALSKDVLNKEYYKLNKFYYGDDVFVDEEIALEWSRIPHFYFNYYVYQYATGFSAAMALSKKIINREENAVENYLNFLKGGCSKSPIDLLKDGGVDMSTPKPIEEALDLFDSLIEELENIMCN